MSSRRYIDKKTLKTLLVEYQKAQDSAEHHDTLIWTVSSIFFAGLLVLLGFIVNSFASSFETIGGINWIFIIPIILGLILILSLIFFLVHFRYYKNLKYYRCKQIEQELNEKQFLLIEQHSLTDPLYDANKHEFKKPLKEPVKPKMVKWKQWMILQILLWVIFVIFFVFIIFILKYEGLLIASGIIGFGIVFVLFLALAIPAVRLTVKFLIKTVKLRPH